MKSGDAIWFKRFPNTDETVGPNSVFSRDLRQLNGKQVCEIIYRGKKWIVRHDEICSGVEEYAKRLKAKIEGCTLLKQTKKDLANNLGVSTSTLRRWEILIAKHLPKEPATVSDGGSSISQYQADTIGRVSA
jgi:hypothetical protein